MDSKDIEIMYMAQIVDVLDVLNSYNTIEEVKKDITYRKQIYINEIKELENSNNK